MRGGPVFLGVYARTDDLERNGEKFADRWHVWGLPDGGFMLKPAPAAAGSGQKTRGKSQPEEGEGRRLSPDEFFLEYRVLSAFTPQEKPGRAAKSAKTPPPDSPAAPVKPAASAAPAAPAKPAAPASGASVITGAASKPEAQNLWLREGGKPAKPASPAASGGKPAENDNVYSWLNSPEAPPKEDAAFDLQVIRGERGTGGQLVWDLPSQDNPAKTASTKQAAKAAPAPEAAPKPEKAVRGGFTLKTPPDESPAPKAAPAPAAPATKPASQAVALSTAEIEKIEEDFRTDFSLALIRLKGKRDEGIATLEKMASSPGPFAPEHKHMFTDCGLALRKRNYYALAGKFHERARQLSPDDEHVLFNQARVMYEAGRIEKARALLNEALELAPDFNYAQDFLAFINGLNRR